MRTLSLPHIAGIGGRPFGDAIHATAVAISEACLLVLGPSGAGKSRLAAALIAASTPQLPICLVGDDRVLLIRRGGTLRARPHPSIAGFLERRGLGLVAYPFVADSIVSGIVLFDPPAAASRTTSPIADRHNLSRLPAVVIDGRRPLVAQRDGVLSWWRDAGTTPSAKATQGPQEP